MLTSRNRVAATLAGARADRVPVDFMGTGCGLGREAYRCYLAHAGMAAGMAANETEPGGAARRGIEVLSADSPFATVYDPELVGRFGLDFRRVGLDSRSFGPSGTDQALVARIPCPGPMGLCVERLGFEAFLALLGENEDEAATRVGEATQTVLETYRLLLGVVGHFVDLVEVADDFAYAGGPFMSPATFARVFQPALALVVETIRELAPGAAVLFHSCGAVLDLVPALVAAGIDVLSPLDPSGRGMAPEVIADTGRRLRTARGQRLVLHGGVAPGLLVQDEAAVRSEVRHLVRTLGAEGGYILAPAGDILEDVAPEKLEAFFRIAAEEARLA